MEFIGKLHPLIVHLPIGLIIAGFGLELIFRKIDHPLALRSVRILIGLAAITGILSSIFGYLLSISSGYDFEQVSTHQWLGIVFSIIVALFFFYRPKLSGKRALWSSWFVVLGVLTATGHYGGSLTHGENYLVESAPDFVRQFLVDDSPSRLDKPLDSILVFQDMVQPVVDQKCLNCHNTEKSKGRLNMETVAGWEKGGKEGDLVVSKDVFASQILQRIYLPLEDKKHMPPKGKRQLSSAEIAVLEWWIGNGGDYDVKLANIELNPRVNPIVQSYMGDFGAVAELDLPDYDAGDMAKARDMGLQILPAAKESNQLQVDFRGDSIVNDDRLAALLPLDKNIVRSDFGFSGVTNEQLKTLAQLENLSYLSLVSTSIDDSGVAHLKELENLQVLNLHSSQVTAACLPQLVSMKGLKKVVLWNTKIPPEELEAFASKNPSLKIIY